MCFLLLIFRAFFSLSFSSYLYQVRGRRCEKQARRSYLQLNINWSNMETNSGDIFIFMLAWQNETSLLKQPKQVNHVIKKKYHSPCFLKVNHKNTVLTQRIYTLGIKRVPPFFFLICSQTGDFRKSLPKNQTNVGPLTLLWSKTGDVCKSWLFSNNY